MVVTSHRKLFLVTPLRFVLATVLLLTLTIAVSAYTLVFRDGRRLEVPSGFALTKTTLTYEVSPGFSRTIQLILIDVAATERANNEAAGAFLKHANQESSPMPVAAPQARVTLTNRELEHLQRRRLESEQNYERRRKELGLPSIEESLRQRAQEEETLLARARARAAEQANDEAFWRTRARALRSEIVATDAEISYLRSRLSEIRQFPLATHSLVTSVLPLVPLATNSAIVPRSLAARRFVSPPRAAVALPGQRGRAWLNPPQSPFGRDRFARPRAASITGFGFPFNGGFGPYAQVGPFDYIEDTYEPENLKDRLDSLLTTRAGLEALWRMLEDEARDAKVPQVWLEP